jgi:hypothetical protein
MMGLWKGLGPNIARNAIINAAELASYDQIKVSLLSTGGAAWLGRLAVARGRGVVRCRGPHAGGAGAATRHEGRCVHEFGKEGG